MLEEIDQSQGLISKGYKEKSSFSENPSVKVTAASLLPVSAARVTARPFFLDALNIPVPSIAFITLPDY